MCDQTHSPCVWHTLSPLHVHVHRSHARDGIRCEGAHAAGPGRRGGHQCSVRPLRVWRANRGARSSVPGRFLVPGDHLPAHLERTPRPYYVPPLLVIVLVSACSAMACPARTNSGRVAGVLVGNAVRLSVSGKVSRKRVRQEVVPQTLPCYKEAVAACPLAAARAVGAGRAHVPCLFKPRARFLLRMPLPTVPGAARLGYMCVGVCMSALYTPRAVRYLPPSVIRACTACLRTSRCCVSWDVPRRRFFWGAPLALPPPPTHTGCALQGNLVLWYYGSCYEGIGDSYHWAQVTDLCHTL